MSRALRGVSGGERGDDDDNEDEDNGGHDVCGRFVVLGGVVGFGCCGCGQVEGRGGYGWGGELEGFFDDGGQGLGSGCVEDTLFFVVGGGGAMDADGDVFVGWTDGGQLDGVAFGY